MSRTNQVPISIIDSFAPLSSRKTKHLPDSLIAKFWGNLTLFDTAHLNHPNLLPEWPLRSKQDPYQNNWRFYRWSRWFMGWPSSSYPGCHSPWSQAKIGPSSWWLEQKRYFFFFPVLIALTDPEAWQALREEYASQTEPIIIRKKVDPFFGLFTEEFPMTESGNSPIKYSAYIWFTWFLDEIENYIYIASASLDEDPLLWWKLHESEFPRLSQLARKFLAVPASQASTERLFSTGKAIIAPYRCSLDPETVEILVHQIPSYNIYFYWLLPRFYFTRTKASFVNRSISPLKTYLTLP